MLDDAARNARALGLDVDDAWPPTPRRCRSRTRASTSSSATPSCTTCPTSTGRSREFHRVLTPGGTLVFAGEPSRVRRPHRRLPEARRVARRARSGAALMRAAPATAERQLRRRRRQPRARGASSTSTPSTPDELARFARGAGFDDVRVRGEELLANWFGWANRALEATAEPEDVPWLWRQYAYRGYLALQERRPRAARAAPAAGDLLQPDARGHEALAAGAAARSSRYAARSSKVSRISSVSSSRNSSR